MSDRSERIAVRLILGGLVLWVVMNLIAGLMTPAGVLK